MEAIHNDRKSENHTPRKPTQDSDYQEESQNHILTRRKQKSSNKPAKAADFWSGQALTLKPS